VGEVYGMIGGIIMNNNAFILYITTFDRGFDKEYDKGFDMVIDNEDLVNV